MKKTALSIIISLFPLFVWAASNTTNLNLYKPASGDKNWAAQVNNDFDIIDTAVGTKLNADGSFKSGAIGLSDLPAGIAGNDTAYGSGWDGSTNIPTQNAVYDKVSTIVSANTTKEDNGQTAFGWGDHASGGYAASSALTSHTGNTSNPHTVTKAQVGLTNATDTADADKPVSTAQQTALNLKGNITNQTFVTPNIGAATATSLTLSGNETSTFPNLTVTDTLTVDTINSTATGATELFLFNANGYSVNKTVSSTLASNVSWIYPPDDGDAGEQLQTNGAGVLTWEPAVGTLLKDLVTTAPLTGGTDDILPGADADITIAIPKATTTADGYTNTTDFLRWNKQPSRTMVITGINATTHDLVPFARFPFAHTISKIYVGVQGGTNVTLGLQECNATYGSCTPVDADILCAAGAVANDDGSLTNPGIAANNTVCVNTTTVNGVVNITEITYDYTLD